jgi:serine/threonine protein kinase
MRLLPARHPPKIVALMSLEPGTRLGPYEIATPIGAGGMGEVYKARDTRLGRTVAIKVLPAHLAESHERKARFAREAKAISQLNHPNICTLYDVGEEDGTDYLVSSCLDAERVDTASDGLCRSYLSHQGARRAVAEHG